ncbi:MAG: NAD-dependent epimerase/dehydratase family protein [Chloroflexota bacterium]|nr:NAD-dependent epimerase/dehydratase family protein [Chloroflexota bacterium]
MRSEPMSPPIPYRRVLVTGGAGFIGSRLTEALVAIGCEVMVLDDLSTGRRKSLPPGLPLIEMDIADPRAVEVAANTGPELIIHAAAQVSVPRSVADPARDRAVNLLGTKHILEGARQAGTRRFVFISSGGAVYGDTAMADEETLPAPASPYGIHKLEAEAEVRASGLSYGIVRYANVYGPGQRSDLEGGVVSIFAEALRHGRPVTIFGSGKQVRDLLYVEDAVRGALAVASSSRVGVWNVATGVPTSVNELLRLLEGMIGPATEVSHEARRAGDVTSSCLSVRRIRREVGWAPGYRVQDGLRAFLNAS